MSRLLQIAQLGHHILRTPAEEVPEAEIGSSAIQSLIDDMLATVADADGVGLAAPQVYQPYRIMIVASRPNARYPQAPAMEPTAMINPQIAWRSAETVKDWEGCLSVPGIRAPVPRAQAIKLVYLSRAGERVEAEYSDFVARIIQHEIDHLDGISFLERVESPREIMMEKEFRKLMAAR